MANRILDLEQKKAALLTSAEALRKAAETESRSLTTEERAQVKAALDEADGIVETINLEKRSAIHTAANANAGNAGTTAHDNALDKPFGWAAVSGETPKQRRARVEAGIGEYLLSVRSAAIQPGTTDPRLLELNRRAAASGASEAVPSDGGFLITPDFSDEIMTIAHDTGMVYTNGRKLPLSENTNAIKIPGIDEQSRADGSRWGGVRMYWQNEADALVGSKPKFRQIELVLSKLTGLFYATDEIIADSRLLGSIVTQAFGEEVGFKMDDAAINGDGAGKPLGILKSNALVTVSKESGQAAATILMQNVTKMWYRLHARSRMNAVWYVNQDVEGQLLTMSLPVGVGGSSVVDGLGPAGGRLYSPAGPFGDGYGRLFGRPVVPIEQAQTLGTVGDIILADMSQWVWVDKGSMQQAVSMHVRFLNDEMTYRFIYRVSGSPIWHTALTPFNGSNSVSPFVALATRA